MEKGKKESKNWLSHKRLIARIFGHTFLRYEKRKNWIGSLPIYLVRCKKHGFFEDYPHGYSSYFACPECDLEDGVARK